MTGEQPAAKENVLSESTPIRVGLVVVLVGAAMSVGGLYFKVESQRERIERLEAANVVLTAQVVALDKNTATKEDVQKATDAINSLTLRFAEFAAVFGAAGGKTGNASYRPRPSP